MRWSSTVTMAFVSALAALGLAACGAEVDLEADDVEGYESPIVNGTALTLTQVQNLGLAAVYHMTYKTTPATWQPRPCTGMVIRTTTSAAWVLTARHCVTQSGIAGVRLQPSEVKVYISATPGVANPNPPAGAVAASEIIDMPATGVAGGEESTARDLALVKVNVDWTTRVRNRRAIYVTNPSQLVGATLFSYGYGLNQDLASCPTTASGNSSGGAGVARYAGYGFPIKTGFVDGPGAYLTFTNGNSEEQKLSCGDSGGPDVLQRGVAMTWEHIVGVHSAVSFGQGRYNLTGYSAVPSSWLQDALEGYYLSSFWDQNRDAGYYSNGYTAKLALYATTQTGNIGRVKYNISTGQLVLTTHNRCLDSAGTLKACDDSTAQKWDVDAYQRIINRSNRQCLAHSGTSSVVVQACSFASAEITSRQSWAFHPQL